MCGIVGIIGKAPVAQRLFDGLKRLEYRGYDSAGIATVDGGVVPSESAVDGLAGYRNSLPVNIGNGASNQLQLDALGNVLLAAKLVGLPKDVRALTEHSARWRPWRSYAAQHLWAALDHAVNNWPPKEK